jgi:hypothetical protein
MMNGKKAYRSFACSVPGASHIKQNRPSQDYALGHKEGSLHIAAAADGHGSESHFLSGRGARFACECALGHLREFIRASGRHEENFKELTTAIVRDWKKTVTGDWNNYVENLAFESAGLEKGGDWRPYYAALNPGYDDEAWIKALDDPIRAYGTTLIAAALIEPGPRNSGFWFGLQIGDGKCMTLGKDGEAAQPIPWDERCCLNVTTSICDSDAADRFRHFYSGTDADLPAAVFIGTDGVDSSYPVHENEKHLAGLYQTIYGNFIREGFDKGEQQLKSFLPLFSEKGSGDDVSIAGIISI